MADLTVTPERRTMVDFTESWIAGVDEIVVTSPDGPAITAVDDLSGKEVFVRESSSYYQSLVELNARLAKDGKPPVRITPAPEELEDEDLLEMANAGLVDILVVDNHKAWFWQRVWPKLKLYPTVALRRGGQIAWGIRKNSPQLETALNRFLATNGLNSLNARMIFRRYRSTQHPVREGGRRRGIAQALRRERIGRETVTYVSNIYKYYVTYLLIQGEYIQRRDLRRKDAVGSGVESRMGADARGSLLGFHGSRMGDESRISADRTRSS